MFKKFSRRHFAKLAGALPLAVPTLAGAETTTPPSATTSISLPGRRNFPDGFVWGTATSAYQVEGAATEDGRGPSIWDRYAHLPGKIHNNDHADNASDHYHRFKDDVQLMKALGVNAYRFSIAWPRVFPDGTGAPNPKGLDFYNRLIDELLANGIQPYATLYHWDLPQALQHRFGGWQSRDTVKAFGDYAGYVAQHLTDRVKHVFTINESATFINFGYGSGPIEMAPGLKLPQAQLNQVRHHVALAHGTAVQAIRASGHADTKIGPAENIVACVPLVETPDNIRASENATRELNAGYLTVMMEGRYTDAFLAYAGGAAPRFTAEDLAIISSPVDFVGINVYMPEHYVAATDDANGFSLLPFPSSFPHMESDWLMVGPEAMYWAPRNLAKLWKPKEVYITENGTSSADQVMTDGKIYDLDRIMYLRNYLTQLQRATSDGVPVKGYFVWSLMDNFEWSDGYSKRFGLYHVDFKTQKRTAKLSADFYRRVVGANALL